MNTHEFRDSILKVEGVSLKLGEKQVLRDVNLEIRDVFRPGCVTGQVIGLLGPSGIGKTRLFRILAGIDSPDIGRVVVGKEQKPVELGRVGVVAQHYPLFAHRTVLGNLVLAGRRGGLSAKEAEEKALGYLKRFDLDDRTHVYPSQLSGGQRQRVAIAQQFMCSEHLLLMDEPFSGLDVVAVGEVIKLITEVACADELNTIILVTHDIMAALEVSDTIWLLGRDHDASGKMIPGARIQSVYDLMELGLAWREGVSAEPEFIRVMREIRERFPIL